MRTTKLATAVGMAAMVALSGCASRQLHVVPQAGPLAADVAVRGDTAAVSALLAELERTPAPAWADSLMRDAERQSSALSDLLRLDQPGSSDTTGLRSLLDSINAAQNAAWSDSLLKELRENNTTLDQLRAHTATGAELQQLLDLLNQPRISTPRPR